MALKNYYKLMGITDEATGEEIKKAYRKMVMEYHPDRNRNDPDCEERLKEINEAYQVLGNEENKRQYDLLRRQNFSRQAFFRDDINDDLMEIFRAFMQDGPGIRKSGVCRGRRGFGRKGCRRRAWNF